MFYRIVWDATRVSPKAGVIEVLDPDQPSFFSSQNIVAQVKDRDEAEEIAAAWNRGEYDKDDDDDDDYTD